MELSNFAFVFDQNEPITRARARAVDTLTIG